jgi:ABC-type phosphate/phosphonate transport system permease subunit
MAPEATRRPFPLRARGAVLLALLVAGAWAAWELDLHWSDLTPNEGGVRVTKSFFSRALTPALASEASNVPEGTPPLLILSLQAAWTTLVYAAASMSLALLLGLFLGFFASTAWWAGDPVGGRTRLGRTVAPAIYGATRVLIGFMRSVHEVIWAVLFLAAFGLTPLAAVIAIAIPYGGTLAKIFSEMIDEAPRGAALALRASGSSGLQVYGFGLLPAALPDMLAYTFYRFECALRSSAVLGFFGYATLGREIQQSFSSTNYGEVWTHLYVLMAIVIVFDLWSGKLRARLTA